MKHKTQIRLNKIAFFVGGFVTALLLIAIISILFDVSSEELFITFPMNILYLGICFTAGYISSILSSTE